MLEARHLVKRYAGSRVVDDVSFVVRPGEVLGYLGPNGSGKSTTVQMLTGLVEPSEGHVCFEGRRITTDLVAFRRRLGCVPEEPHLYPFLSGREHLELIGRLRELPARLLDARIAALLDLLGLGDAALQPISGYSKGMRQKVLIAGALLHDPDVVIFDEPESGLDVTAALMLRHLIRILAERGKAVIYSSHVLEAVEKVCGRVIVLHRGRVVADDSVTALRALRSHSSLEDVFAELVSHDDPERTARCDRRRGGPWLTRRRRAAGDTPAAADAPLPDAAGRQRPAVAGCRRPPGRLGRPGDAALGRHLDDGADGRAGTS